MDGTRTGGNLTRIGPSGLVLYATALVLLFLFLSYLFNSPLARSSTLLCCPCTRASRPITGRGEFNVQRENERRSTGRTVPLFIKVSVLKERIINWDESENISL